MCLGCDGGKNSDVSRQDRKLVVKDAKDKSTSDPGNHSPRGRMLSFFW